MTAETVYIMGAGTSVYADAPTMSNFMEEAYENDFVNPRLRQFLRSFYKKRISKKSLPDIEELLSMIDVAKNREDDLVYKKKGNKDRVFNKHRIEALDFDVRYLIAATLENALSKKPNTDYMSLFLEKVIDNPENPQVAFVSLNYDILLDNALLDFFGVQKGEDEEVVLPINYGSQIMWNNMRGRTYPVVLQDNSLPLIKPHGSLNMLTCDACKSLYLTGSRKGVFETFHKEYKCPWDGTRLHGFIVPPTLLKEFKNEHLRAFWKKFYEVLSTCKKMVFLGYSLPEGDTYFKYMLKRALMRNKNDVQIEVYTGNSSGEKERYEALFGSKIKFENKYFEAYVNDL